MTTIPIDAAEELKLLYKELSTVVAEVNKILQTSGPDSLAFREFDKKASSIVQRINAIQSTGEDMIEI
jgi:hypothetical protein